MKYQIKTDQPQQQFLQIRAEINVSAATTILQFPAWRPGRYELGNFAKNVRSFKVFDENAKLLKFEKISKDQWRVETQGVKQVFVYYSYYAAELNAGSTFLDAKMVYVNPVNCLIYVLGRENESCTLSVDLFKEMHYSGTLPFENNTIAAKTYHELVDSPFIFCDDVESNTYQYVGVDFKISFIGIAHVPWERVIQDFQKFTKVQMDDFRGFPVKSYHFIVIATDYPHYHGVEHLASTVIVLGPSFELFTNLYDELLGVSSHELYHVWNVKSIRSVDLYPYDYSRENYSRMGYLCEGVTTYLGDYYLMISGIWSVDRYLKELTEMFQKHIDNAGRFNSSLAESSFDTWLDGYVVGAPGRKVSIYNEGALFAFITDIFMRQHTQGKISLKDAMYVFYHDYDKKNMGVSEKDFINVVESLIDQDYESLFNALVYRQGSYEGALMDALEFLELELIYSTNPDLAASRLGIQTQQERDCAKITNIAIGSAADLGGLMLGDKIWAINNKVIYGKLQSCLRNFSNQPLYLTIERKGNVICLEMPETSNDHFKRVSLQKIEIPSKLAGRIFSYWSGMKRLKPPRGGSFK
jgi:predicted metalloprotease with PDZ domain